MVRGCSNLKSHCNYTPVVGDVVAYAKLVVLSQVRDRLGGPQWNRLFCTPHIDVHDGISGKEEPRARTRGQRGREVCVPRGLRGCEDVGKEIRFWLVPWSDDTRFRHLWHRCRFFEKTKKSSPWQDMVCSHLSWRTSQMKPVLHVHAASPSAVGCRREILRPHRQMKDERISRKSLLLRLVRPSRSFEGTKQKGTH